jgi:hypothetical protein
MREKLCQLLVGLLFLCGFLPAWADTAPNFSTITVPVVSRSPADLHTAMAAAFARAMIKISGNSQVMSVAAIQQQIPVVERFVQKYSYLDSEVQVTFDQRALLALLIQAQQPVWVSARPATLIWLSVNGQPPAPPSANPILAILQRDAVGRGIPVIFPSMEKLAAHYQAPAILNGELTQQPDQSWTVGWSLVWHGQLWQWRNDGAQEVILQAGIDRLADLMGSQLAVSLNQQAANNLWLAILGINNLTDYNTVLGTVKQLQPVLGIAVQDVGSNGILLQVTSVGEGPAALKSALDSNHHFQPEGGETAAADVLNYRWQP